MARLQLRDVSIDFPLYRGGSQSLKKALLTRAYPRLKNFIRESPERITVRALDAINLDIRTSDRIALIGENGAGKTTLLKVLAGIYEPTGGTIECEGAVSGLLGASVGLDPEATGYENIVLRGMFMNVHPKEMKARVAEIADFTELGLYLDMPVRTYSSGMMVRLSFAIATSIHPEILLLDEWLGAGDASFLQKAQKRMSEFVNRSSILVLASHSMPLLETWCNRGILLHEGRIKAAGPLKEVIAAYRELVARG
jgi:ABC-2 type transport system ATP-binding protein/lipopolysaccharide transport system ATP-binding protein